MSPEIQNRIEYLAAMVASGGASESEDSELETLLQTYPEAIILANEFSEAMTEFALTQNTMAPPADGLKSVRAAILQTISSLPNAAQRPEPIPSRATPKSRLWIASTGFFLVAAAAFAFLWNQASSSSNDAREALDEMSETLASVRTDLTQIDEQWSERFETYRKSAVTKLARLQLLRSPTLTLATLRQDEGATIKIFMEPAGKRWLVYGFDLPEIAGKDYQLWLIGTSGDPVPAGIFLSLGEGLHELEVIVPTDMSNVTQAAVSLEKKGGALSPTDVKMIGPI